MDCALCGDEIGAGEAETEGAAGETVHTGCLVRAVTSSWAIGNDILLDLAAVPPRQPEDQA